MPSILGVDIQVRGPNMVGHYETTMLRRDNSYAMAILNLTRAGLDRALIARKLWVHCGIPAVLFCSEAMVLVISKKGDAHPEGNWDIHKLPLQKAAEHSAHQHGNLICP